MTDPTDTPEPTAEEWRIAQEIDLRYPTTDAYAHALARHRVRVQRETVGRAVGVCREQGRRADHKCDRNDREGNQAAAAQFDAAAISARNCADRIRALLAEETRDDGSE